MTKYEWESELKKNVHRLPDDEIARILEYYDELFADKIERGYTESEITAQFGNPVDVADKILADYEGEAAEPNVPPPVREQKRAHGDEQAEKKEEAQASASPEPPAEPKREKRRGEPNVRTERVLLFALANVLTGFVFFILLGVLWIVLGALTVAFGACAVGGAAGTLVSLLTFAQSAGAGAAQTGACIALAGVGIVCTVACGYGIKWYAKGTKRLFGAMARFLSAKEEVTYA